MLIRNIDTFKETVKISRSAPWDAFSPFVQDAERIYLLRYLGAPLICRMDEFLDHPDSGNDDVKKLLQETQRALGPFSYMLATHETSISFGDAGHTVARTDKLAPANDTKVAKAYDSAEFRGWQNLENLLGYLELNRDKFPEWEHSQYCQQAQAKFFRTAADFQVLGMVDISYSRLTYEKLLQLIRRVEITEIRDLVTKDLYDSLGNPYADVLSNLETDLVKCIQPYIASSVALLHTSQATRQQRTEAGALEYKPLIRPLYGDIADNGNYYAQQLAYWKAKIINLLKELGIDKSGALKWNTPDKKIFCDIG